MNGQIQKSLFAGLDCLPGQLDLFPTDGKERSELPKAAAGPREKGTKRGGLSDSGPLGPADAASTPLAYGYLRCTSSKNRKVGLGMETQRKLIASYFELLKVDYAGVEWGGWIEEKAVSAFKRPLFCRPEGSKLCRLLKPGDHIIFACLDRAFRQIKDLILGREWFEGQKVFFHFVQERIDTSTETGWLMLHIYGLLAEFEARRDSARNKAMHERRRERGLHPCGVAPLGFRWTGVRGSKNLEVDPKHRATIAEIVRLREQEKLGWTEISDRLEEQCAAVEGRKPRPMSQRQWDLYNARRCYARYQGLLLRRKIHEEWRRRRQGSANEPLANGPA